MTENELALAKIFFPRAIQELTRARENNVRFAHYTSADTALKILQSGEIFLRNSSLMNDFSEIRHGWRCLLSAYNSPLGKRLQMVLREIQPDLPEILQGNFNSQILEVTNETYLCSLSEHGDPLGDDHEDKFGRLSMWRAYAPKDGVAFVMKNTPFLGESFALGAFTSPVVYAMPDEFQPAFEEIVVGIEANIGTLTPLGGQVVHDSLMNAFRAAVQSTKHPSFKEEREWRVLYSPSLLRSAGALTDEQMRRIPCTVRSLGGVPQHVYAIPFVDYPDEGFVGATLPELIDRVLIGPSQDSFAIWQAFVAELTRLNVQNAEDKVFVTGVPLRH